MLKKSCRHDQNRKSNDTCKSSCFLVVCVFTSSGSFGELGRDGDVGVDGRRGVLSDGCNNVQKVGLIGLVKKIKKAGLTLLSCVVDGIERSIIVKKSGK